MTTQTLNDLMSFGHVVYSDGNGNVTDKFDADINGPESLNATEGSDPDLTWEFPEWALLRGFTGQYGYNGPVMHDSEYIGGKLEAHIRENAGYYCAAMIDYLPETEDDETVIEGWVVAYREAE